MELHDFELNYIEKWLPEASVKYKDGSPAVNLGLIITVFFKDGHTPESPPQDGGVRGSLLWGV
ncbi:Uncharacterised protein [Escherichia coli]|uniref:Uncharacterized protein n=1 Tax=Escherichia coli TaxID=562 RepID=A0A2X1P9M9_ECOLX|nr:Uncharacterised protein [Escherichia coli]